jgi:hypothetical protein
MAASKSKLHRLIVKHPAARGKTYSCSLTMETPAVGSHIMVAGCRVTVNGVDGTTVHCSAPAHGHGNDTFNRAFGFLDK